MMLQATPVRQRFLPQSFTVILGPGDHAIAPFMEYEAGWCKVVGARVISHTNLSSYTALLFHFPNYYPPAQRRDVIARFNGNDHGPVTLERIVGTGNLEYLTVEGDCTLEVTVEIDSDDDGPIPRIYLVSDESQSCSDPELSDSEF